MGHLLSSAIKMQGADAPATATLQYYVSGIAGGEVIMWKNGIGILDTTTDVALTTTTVNAGDTMYMQFTSGPGFFTTFIYYYFNGVLTATFSGTTAFSSSIYTAAAGNTYKFGYEGLA